MLKRGQISVKNMVRPGTNFILSKVDMVRIFLRRDMVVSVSMF